MYISSMIWLLKYRTSNDFVFQLRKYKWCPFTWTPGSVNWLMLAGSAAAACITGRNGSRDICHPDTAWITGGGREEMRTGGDAATLQSPELFGITQSHGGASTLMCHSWGWALTRWTGIISAASYTNRTENMVDVREVDTGKTDIAHLFVYQARINIATIKINYKIYWTCRNMFCQTRPRHCPKVAESLQYRKKLRFSVRLFGSIKNL